MKKSRLIPILAFSAVLLPNLFLHSCANTTEAPTGGVKDTIPPVIVKFNPALGSVNVPVHGTKFEFTFDEYVTVKTATNIFLSPPLSKMPKSKVRGKSVIVYFEEDLLPGTTYTINFTDAIADANEGNIFPGFTYVFSTGEKIDSMFVTGTVLDSKKLSYQKNITVMVYKDHSDSAVIRTRPNAAAKTDEWGYFCLPFLQDTLYRMYAVKDDNNNGLYDKESEQIAFVDTLIRPMYKVVDSLPELQKYEMKDTALCLARRSEQTLILFRERPDKQYILNKERPGERSAYITFQAPDAWIDSLWIAGYPNDRVITQFNAERDSLEIWVNDKRPAPDTLHLFVSYRKTDSLNVLHPALEHINLMMKDKDGKPVVKAKRHKRKEIKHEDTICVYTLSAKPEMIEQNGFELEFNVPIIEENFDKITFTYLNPKQKEFTGELTVEQDSTNLRRYILRPKEAFVIGNEYTLKIPQRCFRDISGYYCDSLVTKVSLPTEDNLTILKLSCIEVGHRHIVELLDENKSSLLRQYIIDENTTLDFPYLKEGKYTIRITSDENRNSIVDTGSLLNHLQPERVRFWKDENGNEILAIPPGSEVSQVLDFKEIFK